MRRDFHRNDVPSAVSRGPPLVVAVGADCWCLRVLRIPILHPLLLPSPEQLLRHILPLLRVHGPRVTRSLPHMWSSWFLRQSVLQRTDIRQYQGGLVDCGWPLANTLIHTNS